MGIGSGGGGLDKEEIGISWLVRVAREVETGGSRSNNRNCTGG